MSNEKLANEFVLPWAHCPQCSRSDKWRMILERIVPDLPTYKHECECGYVEGDKAGPLGTVSEIPRPADDRGAPYDEPVTRLERVVIAILAGKLDASILWKYNRLCGRQILKYAAC